MRFVLTREASKQNLLLALWVLFLLMVVYLAYGATIKQSAEVNYDYYLGGLVETMDAAGGNLDSAYPPLATVVFTLLRGNRLIRPFAGAWTVLLLAMVVGVVVYAIRYLGKTERWSLVTALVVTIFLLHEMVVLGRYDWLVGVTLFLAWKAWQYDRFRDSAVFVMIAAALKLVPIVWLPLVWILAPAGGKKEVAKGAVISLVLIMVVCWLVLGIDGTWSNVVYMLEFQGGRGIQVESTLSGFNMLINNLGGQKSQIDFHHLAWHNSELGNGAVQLTRWLMIGGAVVAYRLAWRYKGRDRKKLFELLALGLLSWFLAVAPVLSPQFLVWLMPVLVVWLIDRVLEGRVVSWEVLVVSGMTIVVGVATQWLWPFHYDEFIAQNRFVFTLALNLRNSALLALAWFFGSRAKREVEIVAVAPGNEQEKRQRDKRAVDKG